MDPRALAAFRSETNLGYLAALVGGDPRAVRADAAAFAAERGASARGSVAVGAAPAFAFADRAPPSAAVWAGVRALNAAFVAWLGAGGEYARFGSGRAAEAARAGEPVAAGAYADLAFEADSLRPQGHGNLNAPSLGGPVIDVDAPWDDGDPDRSADAAALEYWGEDAPVAVRGSAGTPGTRAYDSVADWGGAALRPADDDGAAAPRARAPRRLRYEAIPVWQRARRAGYERDIRETLGLGALELDYAGDDAGRPSGWDLARARAAAAPGEEYGP